MAVKQGTQNVPISNERVRAFSGGMNTSASPRDIQPNEASLIENLEFDDVDNLVTRNGVSQAFVGTVGPTTSIFSFTTETGFIGNLHTATTNLFSTTIGTPSAGGSITNLTGALVLPNNVRWYWKQLNNVAVGVNGSTGNGNPIQVVGPAPGTASHLAAAPDGKYIEEWNSRLIISHVTNPNRIQFSDLGSATSWNTGGLTNPVQGIIVDVAAGDGDQITALFAFKERLFIFKSKKIYVVRVTALPETDPNNWEVVEYSKIIGCINQSTVREVFDDVVFLSEGGLASLKAAELTADFSSALISRNISEIQRIKKNVAENSILGFVLADKSQYLLIADDLASPTGSRIMWVMDYKQIQKGIRWVTFSGGIIPTAIDLYRGGGQSQQTYLFGIDTSSGFQSMCLYRPNTPVNQRVFVDQATNTTFVKPIISRIHTKAFDFELDEIRKLFKQWHLRFNTLTNKVSFKISYEMDDPLSPVVSYIFDDYGLSFNKEKTVRQSFVHDVQRKSVHCRFIMTIGGEIHQGVSIKNFGINYGILNERRSESMLITQTIKNVSYVIERDTTVLGNVLGGADIIYSFLLPFDSLKTDGDFIDIISGGGLAANNNDKGVLLQLEGDPVTGAGGDFVTGFSQLDFDGAAGFESWTIFARITRLSATSVNIIGRAGAGQIFADGAGAISVTNGLVKADNRNITVADLNLNDMIIQILGTGVATDDILHRQTIIQLNQQ